MSSRRSSEPFSRQSNTESFQLNNLNLNWLRVILSFMYHLIGNFLRIEFKYLNLIHLLNFRIFSFRNGFTNYATQKLQLIEWIYTKTNGKILVKNFDSDFSNGIVLCALLDALIPGLCPRYDLLSKSNSMANINLALDLIKYYLKITTDIKSEDILNDNAENQLVYLLSQIKLFSKMNEIKPAFNLPTIKIIKADGEVEYNFNTESEPEYLAKGMGLILAVKGRKSHFNIFFKEGSEINLIVEIIGPENSFCKEKVTNIKGSAIQRPINPLSTELYRSKISMQENQEQNKNRILFWYRVFKNKISIYYVPSIKGFHTISIISCGRHIVESPYSVMVEHAVNSDFEPIDLYSIALSENDIQGAVEALGRCVSRKVVRQSLIVNGKEVPVCDDLISSQNLVKKNTPFSIRESKVKKNLAPSLNGLSNEVSLINSNYFSNDKKFIPIKKTSQLSSLTIIHENQVKEYVNGETLNHSEQNQIINNDDKKKCSSDDKVTNQPNNYQEKSNKQTFTQLENSQINESHIKKTQDSNKTLVHESNNLEIDNYFDSEIVLFTNHDNFHFEPKNLYDSSKSKFFKVMKKTLLNSKTAEFKQIYKNNNNQDMDVYKFKKFWKSFTNFKKIKDVGEMKILDDISKIKSNSWPVLSLECKSKTELNGKNFDLSNVFLESSFNKKKSNTNGTGIYPKRVIAFGSGLEVGKIFADNYFIVLTKTGGPSFLSVGIQSNFEDAISYINVTYLGDYHYKVNYKISKPGYYILFIRWGDCDIAQSPSILKVY